MSYPTLIHYPGQRSSSAALVIDRQLSDTHQLNRQRRIHPGSAFQPHYEVLAPNPNGTPLLSPARRASTSINFPWGETTHVRGRQRTPDIHDTHVAMDRVPRYSGAKTPRRAPRGDPALTVATPDPHPSDVTPTLDRRHGRFMLMHEGLDSPEHAGGRAREHELRARPRRSKSVGKHHDGVLNFPLSSQYLVRGAYTGCSSPLDALVVG